MQSFAKIFKSVIHVIIFDIIHVKAAHATNEA